MNFNSFCIKNNRNNPPTIYPPSRAHPLGLFLLCLDYSGYAAILDI